LFASVSHDLKSPLNAILGFAELLSREELSAQQRESLALISTRGRELLALIEAILDTARVEAGQLTLLPRDTEVATIVTDAVRKARDLAGESEREVVVEVADGLPTVYVDPAYVTRALAVIVAHAMRSAASDPTAAVLRIRAARHAERDDRVLVDLEHTARGMSAAELDGLFARRTTSRGRGLTLGLSLARSIFELHGGSVEVDGAADRAPIVLCWLPIRPRAPKLLRRPQNARAG